jgi:hypothetical protein
MEDFEEDQPDRTDSIPPSALSLREPRREAALAVATQRIRNVAAVARATEGSAGPSNASSATQIDNRRIGTGTIADQDAL